MSTDRAHVQIVTPPSDEPAAQPPRAAGAALPPDASPPPIADDEVGGGMVGQTFREPAPGPDLEAESAGGGMAARLRARYEQARTTTEEFDIPGWEGELILIARPFRDRKAYDTGVKKEAFIARATAKLLWVDDDGGRHEIPGGWGEQLAGMIGVDVSQSRAPASDLVALVCDNPVRVDALATQLLEWMAGARAEVEQQLGE